MIIYGSFPLDDKNVTCMTIKMKYRFLRTYKLMKLLFLYVYCILRIKQNALRSPGDHVSIKYFFIFLLLQIDTYIKLYFR